MNSSFLEMLKYFVPFRQDDETIIAQFDKAYSRLKKLQKKSSGDSLSHITNKDRKTAITTARLRDLKPMFIKEMGDHLYYPGHYVKLKFIRNCFKMNAIQGLVEDEKKTITVISIYNFPLKKKKYSEVFYEGLEIFVKEPFYKLNMGTPVIRIDDPNDIEFKEDPKESKDWTAAELAAKINEEGNQLFAEGNFLDALDSYGNAIKVENNDEKISALWTNKALCLENLNCIEETLEACETALKFNPNNKKAIFRKINSLILLNRTDDAENQLQKYQNIVPDPNRLKKKLAQKLSLLDNKVDWMPIFDQYDAMQFMSPKITLKKSEAAGNMSFFCKQSIQPYEVLIIEKPIASVEPDKAPEQTFLLDFDKSRMSTTSNMLLNSKIEKLSRASLEARKKIQCLWTKDNAPLSLLQRQNQTITYDDMYQKLALNTYQLQDFRSCQDKIHNYACIYQKRSDISHRCTPNITEIFIKDTSIIMSSVPIKKGEQIFGMYRFDPQDIKNSKKKRIECGTDCQHCEEYARYAKQINSSKKGKKFNPAEFLKTYKTDFVRTNIFVKLIETGNVDQLLKHRKEIEQGGFLVPILRGLYINNGLCLLSEEMMKFVVKMTRKVFGSVRAVKGAVEPEIFLMMQVAEEMMV